MGWFTRRKKEDSADIRTIERLDGRELKYVTLRGVDEGGGPVETVLGKTGRINALHEDIVIVCDGTEVFRCDKESAKCGELMSLDGVVVTGVNRCVRHAAVPVNETVTVVAYYKYYRWKEG